MSQVGLKTDSLPPGAMIGDKYVIERVLGLGGVGVVYAARHANLDDHRVAIKLLRSEVQANTDVVARFAREAQATVKIKSEHAVRVFDVGVAPEHGPYLVMEFLEGRDLGDALAATGRLPPKLVVDFAIQVCEALAVSHLRGIIHRDIKPENLFLARRADGTEVVKVLDFGISKAALTGSVFGGDGALIETKSLMGSPLYMSPEQMRSTGTVDHRTDIWSLGVVIYELLTGRMPFSGETITRVCAEVLEREPPPVTAHSPETPPGLAQAVARCLSKNPDRRFQNVAELARALAPYGGQEARVLAERVAGILRQSGTWSEEEAAPDEAPTIYQPRHESPVPVASPQPPVLPPAEASPRAVVFAAAMAAILFAVSVTAYVVHARVTHVAPADTAPAVSPPPPPQAEPLPTPAATPAAPPPTGVTSVAPPPRPPPVVQPLQPQTPPARRPPVVVAPPPPKPPVTTAPATGADCTPPYYYEGTKKIFKPQCI